MCPETVAAETVFTLRVPQTLNEKLIVEARSENRSRQSHIVYLLNKHFENAADKSGKKEKTK
jgi:hypothetical protein